MPFEKVNPDQHTLVMRTDKEIEISIYRFTSCHKWEVEINHITIAFGLSFSKAKSIASKLAKALKEGK